MNIFILDENPNIAAEYHYDSHVRKLILEAVQMMMTTYHMSLNAAVLKDFKNNENAYSISHKNHPSTVWVRKSLDNFKWLLNYAEALNNEFKFRWNKTNDHLSIVKMRKIIEEYGLPPLEEVGLTDFPIVMPKPLIIEGKPVDSYRRYYLTSKLKLMKYTNREMPYWVEESINAK